MERRKGDATPVSFLAKVRTVTVNEKVHGWDVPFSPDGKWIVARRVEGERLSVILLAAPLLAGTTCVP